MVVAHRLDPPSGCRLTHNFWTWEFACNCIHRTPPPDPAQGFCMGALNMNDPAFFKLVEALQRLRDAHSPIGGITLERGYSCFAHHERIYDELGKPPTLRSPHLFGLGADCWIRDGKLEKSDENRRYLRSLGFTGIGWNMGKRQNKIHLDTMPRLADWDYAA